jgi:hypothetical protein
MMQCDERPIVELRRQPVPPGRVGVGHATTWATARLRGSHTVVLMCDEPRADMCGLWPTEAAISTQSSGRPL